MRCASTIVGWMVLFCVVVAPLDVSAQRFRPRFPSQSRQPLLPAPFNTLKGADAQHMSHLGQLSVAWLAGAPVADIDDPTIDLFGPFGGKRPTTEEGEEIPQNELGIIVLSGWTPPQRRMLLDLVTRQQSDMAKYREIRARLIAAFGRQRGTTKQDRTIDRDVRELSEELGALEGAMAFDQAVTYAKLAATLTEDQETFQKRLRQDTRSFNRDAASVTAIRDAVLKLDPEIQLPLQESAAKACSYLTGSAAENAKQAPQRTGILGDVVQPLPVLVKAFLKDAPKAQHQEYLKLLAADADASTTFVAKRVQLLEALDLQKRSQSASDAKVVALAKQCGELEARRALARIRSIEKIREDLTADQRFTLQQAVE